MLKKILYICLLMSLFSCEKIFINGNLDGMWRLVSVEKGHEVINPESIFYSFQRHLVMMGVYSETKHPENYYMGCFVYENDSIVMDNFYRYPGMSGDCVPKELENLYIYDIVAKFEVQHLSSEKLVMTSNDIRYTFRKW